MNKSSFGAGMPQCDLSAVNLTGTICSSHCAARTLICLKFRIAGSLLRTIVACLRSLGSSVMRRSLVGEDLQQRAMRTLASSTSASSSFMGDRADGPALALPRGIAKEFPGSLLREAE